MKTPYLPALVLALSVTPAWAQLSAFPALDPETAEQLGQQISLIPQAAAAVARAGWTGWHERQAVPQGTQNDADGSVWGRIHYGSVDHEIPLGGALANDHKQRSYGFNAGVDLVATAGLRFGLTTGYTRSILEFQQLDTEADFDSVGAGLYGNYASERFYVDVLYRHAWSELDIQAPALGIQSENDQLSGKVGSDSLHIETGIRLLQTDLAGGVLSVEPLLNLEWMRVSADEINVPPQDPLTHGRDGDALVFADHDSTRAGLGARTSLSHAIFDSARMEYSLLLRYWREFERDTQTSVRRYDNNRVPIGEVAFAHEADSGSTELKLGLALNHASGRAATLLNATGYTGSRQDGWNVTVGMRYLW